MSIYATCKYSTENSCWNNETTAKADSLWFSVLTSGAKYCKLVCAPLQMQMLPPCDINDMTLSPICPVRSAMSAATVSHNASHHKEHQRRKQTEAKHLATRSCIEATEQRLSMNTTAISFKNHSPIFDSQHLSIEVLDINKWPAICHWVDYQISITRTHILLPHCTELILSSSV